MRITEKEEAPFLQRKKRLPTKGILKIHYAYTHLKKPVIRESGAWKGRGFKKIDATNSSTASSTKHAEKKCEAIHRLANLKMPTT